MEKVFQRKLASQQNGNSVKTKCEKNEKSDIAITRSSHSEMFLGKGVLIICSKFTEEHLCESAISIKL